jgi:hypothetical protein
MAELKVKPVIPQRTPTFEETQARFAKAIRESLTPPPPEPEEPLPLVRMTPEVLRMIEKVRK